MVPMLMVALLVTSGAAGAQVYKCKGDGGRIVYSDAPCPAAGVRMESGVLNSNTLPTPAAPAAPAARRLERESQPAAGAGPQAVVIGGSRRGCPTELELKNLQTAAASITASKEEIAARRQAVAAAQRCRTRGTNYADELGQIQDQAAAEQQQKEATKEAVREQLRKCHVWGEGNISCR